jgi:hypothetical protein
MVLALIGIVYGSYCLAYDGHVSIPPSQRDWVNHPGQTTMTCGAALPSVLSGAPRTDDVEPGTWWASACLSADRKITLLGSAAILFLAIPGIVLVVLAVRIPKQK